MLAPTTQHKHTKNPVHLYPGHVRAMHLRSLSASVSCGGFSHRVAPPGRIIITVVVVGSSSIVCADTDIQLGWVSVANGRVRCGFTSNRYARISAHDATRAHVGGVADMATLSFPFSRAWLCMDACVCVCVCDRANILHAHSAKMHSIAARLELVERATQNSTMV